MRFSDRCPIPTAPTTPTQERWRRAGFALGGVVFVVILLALLFLAVTAWAAQMLVTWQDNATDEDEFRLERMLHVSGRHPWVEIAVLPPNTTSYTDTGLDSGEEYSYRVRACNTAGCSDYSNVDADRTTRLPKGNEFGVQ